MNQYVLTVGGGMDYYSPFEKFGQYSTDQSLFNFPEKISLVLFTGGADVSPSIYYHKKSKTTFCHKERDIREILAFRRAIKHKLPMVGVCRGAQFLCVMSGGTLFQHVENHGGFHEVELWDGRTMMQSSTHHQMQNPPEGAKVLAWASPRRSKVYIVEDDIKSDPPPCEYECVHYPMINAVGLQYHPEMMSEKSEGWKFASESVDNFLMRKVEKTVVMPK